MDNHDLQDMLNTVQNYVRNMSKGLAKMDLGVLGEEEKEEEEDKAEGSPDGEEYLGYMGKK
eukprot:5529969-Karenia_brevis.AAC.1